MWQPQGFYSEYMLKTPVMVAGEKGFSELYNYPGRSFAIIYGTGMSPEQKELIGRTLKKKKVTFLLKSWIGEPSIENLSGTIRELETCRPDVIVAVGGGSVLDGAKLCRLFYEFPYLDETDIRLDGGSFKTKFIAVPTTTGSGAEVSSAAVFADPVRHRKNMVVHHGLQPDVVVYDAQNVRSMSHRLLCASALDAAAHMIEGYVSTVKNKMMDIFAEKGLSLLRQECLGNHPPDWGRLQYAGFLGGMVQNHCIVGAAHGIAHQLAEDGYSHSEAVGMLLPSVMKINGCNPQVKGIYDQLAEHAGFKDSEGIQIFLNGLLESGGIKGERKELKKLLLRKLDDKGFIDNVVSDRGGKGNPVPITQDYLAELVRSL